MKKLTKILSVLLACAMLFAMAIPATIASAEDKVDIVLETVEAKPGDTGVTLKVFAESAPVWSAVDITFTFDASKLTYKSWAFNSEILNQMGSGEVQALINKNDAANGTVIVAFTTVSTAGGYEGYYPGEYDYLGTIKFDVAPEAKGNLGIAISVNKLCDNLSKDVAYTLTDGGVKVVVEPCAECTDWDQGVVTTPATCEGKGVMTYTCNKCGNTKTEEIAELGHAWGEWRVTKEPTTTEKGERTRVCENDASHVETESIDALPFEGLDIVIETVAGKAGDEVKVKVFVPATPIWSAVDFNFAFDASKITYKSWAFNPAILDQMGSGEVQALINKNDAANGSVIIAFTTVSTAGGYEGYYPGEYDYLGTLTFTVADSVEDGLIPISATINKLVNKDSDDIEYRITNGGVEITSCEHNWVETSRTPATCEEDGEIVYTCSGTCGGTKTEAIPAIGHAWDNGVVTTEPTCSAEGVKTYTCANDATHTKTEAVAINPDAHKYNETGKTAPTCEADGSTVYTCEYCQHEKTEAIPAIGHAWDNGVVTTEPTCTTEGVKTYTCANDATHTKTEAIAINPDAHKIVDKVVVDATCTEAGSETGTCELCQKEVVVEIPALGHDWDEGKVTKEPTADAEGEKTYTCGTCGETKTEAIEKLPAEEKPDDDNTNTGDIALASSAIVALVASAAVLVITRKKRLAK